MKITPDDLDVFVRDVVPGSATSLKGLAAAEVFVELTSAIEPHLIAIEAGGAYAWRRAVREAEIALRTDERGRIGPLLSEVVRLATLCWHATDPSDFRSLPFVRDQELRRIAEDDWARSVAANRRDDAKAVAIAAGSVVEAIALDILRRENVSKLRDKLHSLRIEQRRNAQFKSTDPEEWKLVELIVALGPCGLGVLSERTETVGQYVREMRNCIHPARYAKEQPLRPADGRMIFAFAELVLQEVEQRESATS